MIVDTSALIAILFSEDGADEFFDVLAAHDSVISAGTLLEARIVAQGRGGLIVREELDALILNSGTKVINVDDHLAMVGSEAHRRYGRGSGHRAKLNFGDCFAYALAKTRDEPLLCKGGDFVHTDVALAV